MSDPTFREILQTGGGNIQYVFHVSGYPWAVCTSQDCATQLDNPLNVTARRAIFGIEEDTGNYWADDVSLCPIFPTLRTPGKQKWKLHEGKGELTGGDWSVEILDRELGHSWEHGGSSAGFRGLPGVHHVLGPDYDSSVGWAFLTSNLEIGDDSFTVREQSGSTLINGIDGAGTFPHRLLWVNQECIVADAVVGSSPDYTIEISKDASNNLGRGMFRSKHQNHYREYYATADPIVTDTPFSIIDKPCWLWAVVLTEDGSDIMINPVCIRSGLVSPSVQTRDGLTKIGVLSPIKQLDGEVRTPAFIEHLDRYLFTRQKEETSQRAGLDRQCPHLVIMEFNDAGVATQYKIWLCENSETSDTVVEFDTVEDVLTALDTELGFISNGSNQQKSNDPNDGFVTTSYRYSIENGRIVQRKELAGPEIYYRSLITGPLAWLFNLGPVFNKINDLFTYHIKSNNPWFFRWSEVRDDTLRTVLKHSWMCCSVTDDTISNTNFKESDDDILLAHHLVPHEAWVTPFFYQFPYNTDEIRSAIGNGSAKQWTETFVGQMDTPTGTLYFRKEADLDNINIDDLFIIGKQSDWMARPRWFQGTIETKGSNGGTSADYPYVTIDSDVLYPATNDKASPIYYGVGLWYIPALETDLTQRDQQDQWSPKYVGPTDALQRFDPTMPFLMDSDPLIFTQMLSGESNGFSDPFRALLNDDGASYTLSNNLTMSEIIGFSDASTEDVDTWIDWDVLDNYSGTILPGKQTYRLSCGSAFNIWDQLRHELVAHGLMPTYEWDDSLDHFIIRFREIGPINITAANESGRYLTEKTVLRNSQMIETHNDTWMFNKIVMRCNYFNGEYKGNVVVDLATGNAQNRNSSRTLKSESQLSQIDGIMSLDDSDIGYITKKYSSMLRTLAIPNTQYKVKTNLAAMVDLAIGRECLITDSTGFYPFSHERGLVEAPALVTAISTDLAKNQCDVTCRLTKNHTKGWAPAAYVTASSKETDGITVQCTVTPNYFSASGDRWDCTYFDCYNYNKSSGVYEARSCSCGNYAVIVFARNTDGTSWEPTLMYFDVTSVDTTDGNSMTLVDQDGGQANYTAWDEADEHIIIFAAYDDCEECQQKYIFFAGDDNKIGTGSAPGTRWM